VLYLKQEERTPTLLLLLPGTASALPCFCILSAIPLNIPSVDLTRSQAYEDGDLKFQGPHETPDLPPIKDHYTMTTTAKTTTNTAVDVQEQYAHAAQTMAKHLAAAQARNLKYTQSIFESTIALLKSHMEDTRSLMEQWGQQEDSKVSESYMNLFSAPFTAYQQMIEGVETASRQMIEGVEKATKQSFESFEQADHSKIGTARK